MARPTMGDATLGMGTILGTESSGGRHAVFTNDRADGASITITAIKVKCTSAAQTGGSSYSMDLLDHSGEIMGTVNFAGSAITVTTGTTVSLTTANCVLDAGETMSAFFTQSGSGQTIQGLGVHIRYTVQKKAT